jgi:hypothetical protein
MQGDDSLVYLGQEIQHTPTINPELPGMCGIADTIQKLSQYESRCIISHKAWQH